jgi:phage tail sheath protein FI
MIQPVPTSITAFVGLADAGPTDEPTSVRSFADFTSIFGGLSRSSTMSYAVRDYFANGGREAIVARVAEGTDSEVVPQTPNGKGLYALDAADLFNVLCILPPARGSDLPTSALAAASAYCAQRRALLLVDPPSNWQQASDVVAGAGPLDRYAALTRENAAAYFPELTSVDPLEGTVDTFPPSGAVAGVIARTDVERGVWKAPAGQAADLRGIEGLSAALTDDDARALGALGINPLRTFPGMGNLVWGARTLAGADALASDWKYVPVRRLALFLEESIDRGTKWAANEPNGEPLWAELRLEVGAFMLDLFRKGAFQGTTPDRAYFVKCDGETTTQDDIDDGVVNILVGFAAAKPSEFVLIRIRQVVQS